MTETHTEAAVVPAAAPVPPVEKPPDSTPAAAVVEHTPGGWPVVPLAVTGTNSTIGVIAAAAVAGGPLAAAVAATGAAVLGTAAVVRSTRTARKNTPAAAPAAPVGPCRRRVWAVRCGQLPPAASRHKVVRRRRADPRAARAERPVRAAVAPVVCSSRLVAKDVRLAWPVLLVGRVRASTAAAHPPAEQAPDPVGVPRSVQAVPPADRRRAPAQARVVGWGRSKPCGRHRGSRPRPALRPGPRAQPTAGTSRMPAATPRQPPAPPAPPRGGPWAARRPRP